MKILVACEESQAVTIELRKLGHEAYSCDIEPCSGGHPEWHLQQDVTQLLKIEWDMIIAFPPCTHLAMSTKFRKPDQIIQPWQFGHGETKATCLWLKGLPKLEPTEIVEGREQRIWKMPPGPDRAKERSKTFPGIAKAMAKQWAGEAESEE